MAQLHVVCVCQRGTITGREKPRAQQDGEIQKPIYPVYPPANAQGTAMRKGKKWLPEELMRSLPWGKEGVVTGKGSGGAWEAGKVLFLCPGGGRRADHFTRIHETAHSYLAHFCTEVVFHNKTVFKTHKIKLSILVGLALSFVRLLLLGARNADVKSGGAAANRRPRGGRHRTKNPHRGGRVGNAKSLDPEGILCTETKPTSPFRSGLTLVGGGFPGHSGWGRPPFP